VEVEVEDTGLGMPKEVMDKAIDPFFTTKPQGKGTGLGLSIVYSTVKAHRGTMELQSAPGTGTRVTLRFPACEPHQTAEGAPAEPAPVRASGGLDILLVDDDEVLRVTVAAMVQRMGHRVAQAGSGEEALTWLEGGEKPRVIILDVNMPGLGGKQTLPRLRALLPEVPVLLTTGRADQGATELAQAFPGVTLLPKPFGMEELRKRLDAFKPDCPPSSRAPGP
jgi:CheY-like chemotaxis protein